MIQKEYSKKSKVPQAQLITKSNENVPWIAEITLGHKEIIRNKAVKAVKASIGENNA